MSALLLTPDWPLPDNIRAAYSYGYSGSDCQGYGDFNLAEHVGDDPRQVAAHRQSLRNALALPAEPLWLNQVHGIEVAEAGRAANGADADAAVCEQPGGVVAVLTADCLPVLFYSQTDKTVVAAAHAGWRGLAAGILEATVEKMAVPPASISCWLGPAIGPRQFEVGAEVRDAFVNQMPESEVAFMAQGHKFLANLSLLARLRLQALGVAQIFAAELCTVEDQRFYSYRRSGIDEQGQVLACGRMASMIWFV